MSVSLPAVDPSTRMPIDAGQADMSLYTSFRGLARGFHSHRVAVGVLAAAYVLLLSVIGLQNVAFWDDSNRRLGGFTAWGQQDGRWGSEVVAWLLYGRTGIVDPGVGSFVISGLILAVAAAVVVFTLAAPLGGRVTWLTWLMALLLGLTPWYLNAAAFRFDGPFFALSILFAVSTALCYRARPTVTVSAFFMLTWVTANFFQITLGIIITLLMTRLLLDWMGGWATAGEALRRFGLAALGFGAGALLYLVQVRRMGAGRQEIEFDFSIIHRTLPRNTFLFLRTFIIESGPTWLVCYALVFALAVYGLVRYSQRALAPTLAVIVIYFGLAVIASGGVLLLATREHIIVQARFRFPLAFGIAMVGLLAALLLAAARSGGQPGESQGFPALTSAFPLPIRVAAQALLACFAYLWLSVLPVFALAVREQQDTLRFQSSLIFADAFQLFRPGDTIIYDPQIFTNALMERRAAETFPIFRNSTYIGLINLHSDSVRFRLIEMLGLGRYDLFAVNDYPGLCSSTYIPPDQTIRGPRWEIWREPDSPIGSAPEAAVVCAVFPRLAEVARLPDGTQKVVVDLNRFPFEPGDWFNAQALVPTQVQMAVWSVHRPDDVRWLNPSSLVAGVATFDAPPPLEGWTGDVAAAHFFINDEYLFQQIWSLPNAQLQQ